MKLKLCLRVYASGQVIVKYFNDEQTEDWVKFNKEWRPGCALVVDGKIVNNGYLDDESIIIYISGHTQSQV